VDDPWEDIRKALMGGARIRLERISPTVTCQTSATQILPGNPNRIAWMIVSQDTTNTVRIDWSSDVTTARGLFLGAQGTAKSHFRDDGDQVKDPVWGIASTANVTLYVRAWEVY
jgi:hypothetical protein